MYGGSFRSGGHPWPSEKVENARKATSDAAFRALLERFTNLYAERLFNLHWGEQASARPDNRFEALMLFQGLDEAAAREAWRPLIACR